MSGKRFHPGRQCRFVEPEVLAVPPRPRQRPAARGARRDRRGRHAAAAERQGRRRRVAGRSRLQRRRSRWGDGCDRADRLLAARALSRRAAARRGAPRGAWRNRIFPARAGRRRGIRRAGTADSARAAAPAAQPGGDRRGARGAADAAAGRLLRHGVPPQPSAARPISMRCPGTTTSPGCARYGFHGLSYEYIAAALPHVAPEIARGR